MSAAFLTARKYDTGTGTHRHTARSCRPCIVPLHPRLLPLKVWVPWGMKDAAGLPAVAPGCQKGLARDYSTKEQQQQQQKKIFLGNKVRQPLLLISCEHQRGCNIGNILLLDTKHVTPLH